MAETGTEKKGVWYDSTIVPYYKVALLGTSSGLAELDFVLLKSISNIDDIGLIEGEELDARESISKEEDGMQHQSVSVRRLLKLSIINARGKEAPKGEKRKERVYP